jgi:hypothetical protein
VPSCNEHSYVLARCSLRKYKVTKAVRVWLHQKHRLESFDFLVFAKQKQRFFCLFSLNFCLFVGISSNFIIIKLRRIFRIGIIELFKGFCPIFIPFSHFFCSSQTVNKEACEGIRTTSHTYPKKKNLLRPLVLPSNKRKLEVNSEKT